MQVQDYLPFFKNLLLHYYQFTLENPAYAICLAVSVWLLTTIFYSLRIGFLNRRNRINLTALSDTKNELTAAQLQIQQLQEQLTAANEQFDLIKAETEQQTQRAATLQSRISRLDSQLSESIGALTTNADLSEQFSPSADGLETEDLWQRYSAINKQVSANLATERKTNNELQQAYKAETAKLAEKDQQLFTLQARVDSQSQQIAQLESTVEQHKTLLSEQQASTQQRLSEIDAQHQADLARLTAMQQQALELSEAQQQQQIQLQEKLNAQSAVIAQQQEVKAVEIKAVEPQSVALEPKPQQIEIQPEPLPVKPQVISEVVAPKPAIVIAETPKQQPVKTPEKATGVAGKFKSFFAGAKKKIDKMDGKLVGQSDITPEPEVEAEQVVEPVIETIVPAIEIPAIQPEVLKVDDQLEVAITEVLHVPAEEPANAFVAKAWSTTDSATSLTLSGKPPAGITPQPVKVLADEAANARKQPPSKLKNLLGKFKRKS